MLKKKKSKKEITMSEQEFDKRLPLNPLEIPNSTSNSDGSVSIKISKETIEKLLDWVNNERRRLKKLQ